jgi:transcriptional regulator with XRE-family HTH domain
MDVGKRIKWFREKKGITVNKLANLAGISQSFLREIELGGKKPTVETLTLVCEALGITLKDFFDDETVSPLQNDELSAELFRLTPAQRKKLAEFLHLMKD